MNAAAELSETELSEIVRMDIISAPSGMPAKAIAEGLGKNYFTLMKETNPAHPSHKFALDLIVPAMRLTGSTRPIERIAEEMNGVFTPIPEAKGPILSSTQQCIRALGGAFAYLYSVAQAYEDGEITEEEYLECSRRARKATGYILTLLECVRKDKEAQPCE